MKKNKFESIFANIKIRQIVSEEKDKYLSVASLEKLKKFIQRLILLIHLKLISK